MLAGVLVGVLSIRLVYGPTQPTGTVEREASVAAGEKHVSLTIDFGNGVVREFSQLAWRKGMTIEHLMAAASQQVPAFAYEQQGTGATAFLTQIDGLGGRPGERRYWQYWVNEARGERSFGAQQLQPGDHVLWKFAPQE